MKVRFLTVNIEEELSTNLSKEELLAILPDLDAKYLAEAADGKEVVVVAANVCATENNVDTKPEDPMTFEQMVMHNMKMITIMKKAVLAAAISTLKYPEDPYSERPNEQNIRQDLYSLAIGMLYDYNKIVGTDQNCDTCPDLSICGGMHSQAKEGSSPNGATDDIVDTNDPNDPNDPNDITQILPVFTHKKTTTIH